MFSEQKVAITKLLSFLLVQGVCYSGKHTTAHKPLCTGNLPVCFEHDSSSASPFQVARFIWKGQTQSQKVVLVSENKVWLPFTDTLYEYKEVNDPLCSWSWFNQVFQTDFITAGIRCVRQSYPKGYSVVLVHASHEVLQTSVHTKENEEIYFQTSSLRLKMVMFSYCTVIFQVKKNIWWAFLAYLLKWTLNNSPHNQLPITTMSNSFGYYLCACLFIQLIQVCVYYQYEIHNSQNILLVQ